MEEVLYKPRANFLKLRGLQSLTAKGVAWIF